MFVHIFSVRIMPKKLYPHSVRIKSTSIKLPTKDNSAARQISSELHGKDVSFFCRLNTEPIQKILIHPYLNTIKVCKVKLDITSNISRNDYLVVHLHIYIGKLSTR